MTDHHRETDRPRSSLVFRLLRAQGDPAKRQVRAWLAAMDDARLADLGLSSADIAALRGGAGRNGVPPSGAE